VIGEGDHRLFYLKVDQVMLTFGDDDETGPISPDRCWDYVAI